MDRRLFPLSVEQASVPVLLQHPTDEQALYVLQPVRGVF